eukprot:16429813-Heterocapsa_arctica.AAC.1
MRVGDADLIRAQLAIVWQYGHHAVRLQLPLAVTAAAACASAGAGLARSPTTHAIGGWATRISAYIPDWFHLGSSPGSCCSGWWPSSRRSSRAPCHQGQHTTSPWSSLIATTCRPERTQYLNTPTSWSCAALRTPFASAPGRAKPRSAPSQ